MSYLILLTIIVVGYVVFSVVYTKMLLRLRALERKVDAIKQAADKAVYIGSDEHPTDVEKHMFEYWAGIP